MQASDRFNINSQLEHLQAKYVGTGHADLNRLYVALSTPSSAPSVLHPSTPCGWLAVRAEAFTPFAGHGETQPCFRQPNAPSVLNGADGLSLLGLEPSAHRVYAFVTRSHEAAAPFALALGLPQPLWWAASETLTAPSAQPVAVACLGRHRATVHSPYVDPWTLHDLPGSGSVDTARRSILS